MRDTLNLSNAVRSLMREPRSSCDNHGTDRIQNELVANEILRETGGTNILNI